MAIKLSVTDHLITRLRFWLISNWRLQQNVASKITCMLLRAKAKLLRA